MTGRKIVFAALALLLVAGSVWPQNVEFKLVTEKNVTAYSDIAIIRDELFLGTETIDRILIADILNDGFDENDMVQLYPSGRVLRLQPISARLDSLLRSYRLPPNTAVFESRHYYAENDSVAVMSRGGRALGYGILGGIEERARRHLVDVPVGFQGFKLYGQPAQGMGEGIMQFTGQTVPFSADRQLFQVEA